MTISQDTVQGSCVEGRWVRIRTISWILYQPTLTITTISPALFFLLLEKKQSECVVNISGSRECIFQIKKECQGQRTPSSLSWSICGMPIRNQKQLNFNLSDKQNLIIKGAFFNQAELSIELNVSPVMRVKINQESLLLLSTTTGLNSHLAKKAVHSTKLVLRLVRNWLSLLFCFFSDLLIH